MRLSKFLAARRRARGQPHDTHAVDRVHSLGKRDFFGLKPMGKDVLWSAPVNPASEEVGSVDPIGSVAVAAGPDQREAVAIPFASEA